jgi:hypothetical protein
MKERQLDHCDWCEEFPCHWFNWNPEEPDKATFAANRQKAINDLLPQREVGTVLWREEQTQAAE